MIDHPPSQVHVFAASTFALGRQEVVGQVGERFYISDRERTVVDVFRLRHVVGEDLAYAALREYLRSRPKLARLAEVAQALGVWATPAGCAPGAAGMTQPARDTKGREAGHHDRPRRHHHQRAGLR